MDASLLTTTTFPTAGREDWLKLARKAIGEADFDAALVSSTDDGIRIEPLSDRRADPAHLVRANVERPWQVIQRIDDPDPARANAQARQDLEGGATGLSIVFEGAPNAFGYGLPATPEALAAALDGISFADTHVRIDVHPSSRSSVDWLMEELSSRRTNPARLRLAFGIDPAAVFAGTGRLRMSIEALQASMPQSLAHFFALGVPGVLVEADGRVYHNAGATEAQELGAVLATAAAHLRMFQEARQPLVYAAPHVGFALAADQDQFLTIAKFRALRKLWLRLQEVCRIEPSPASIHAETSYRMMTHKDPETNILRTTIACFAAAAGGADSVSILPYTIAHGLPDGFARRIARNTQLVLADESHVGFVADPMAGSGSVEALTDALCQSAWLEFQAIEAEGGILESLAAGKLQARVGTAAAKRRASVAEGKRPIVGTTLYPMAKERQVSLLHAERRPAPTDGAVFCEPLPPHRLDQFAEPAR
ncbi:MAG: methylmalonyl-CoA mutase subunit beta [Mesorhizobium sp.]|nr:methylmalonyl-CoA mutase subunit beta [Mesorhizobium sp.]